MVNVVRVADVTTHGDTLVGTVEAEGPVERFVTDEEFVTRYGTDIGDVPESILTIPILAHVCPVAWATGADVEVSTVDREFLEALREVGETLVDMYPSFMEGGTIRVGEAVAPERAPGAGEGSAALFTGGVDSMATYVGHEDEDPDLVSVQGWVVGEDERERWERTKRYITDFADGQGVGTRFVNSNMLSVLAMPLLQAHFQRYLDGAWYSSVGHGLGMLALCAPLAYAEDIGTLYIAATHTEEWSRPWGSAPEIDDRVRWSGTQCVHDGYDLDRVEKIERIAEFAERQASDVRLRTCTHTDSAANCNDCEKCYRTMLGLLLAGVDPNDYGYTFDASSVDEVREKFETGTWKLSPQKAYHWNVLQDAASPDQRLPCPRDGELLSWLLTTDFDQYVCDRTRSTGERALQTVARHTPTPVFTTLYPVYQQLTSR